MVEATARAFTPEEIAAREARAHELFEQAEFTASELRELVVLAWDLVNGGTSDYDGTMYFPSREKAEVVLDLYAADPPAADIRLPSHMLFFKFGGSSESPEWKIGLLATLQSELLGRAIEFDVDSSWSALETLTLADHKKVVQVFRDALQSVPRLQAVLSPRQQDPDG